MSKFGDNIRGSFNKQGKFFSVMTYNSDRSLIFYFFVFLLIHMDKISFAEKNNKFKSFDNKQKCQIKRSLQD